MKEKDEKKYVIIKCPFCKSDLRFEKEPRFRRVHTMCKKCNKVLEVVVK